MKVVAQNRRAKFDYEIIDTLEAGVILTGQEVKSCRSGHVNLSGAYVSFLSGKPVLKNSTIAPYAFASGLDDYKPGRERELLISKKDREKLLSASEEKGVAIIPLEIRAGKFIKVLLGLGKGRKTIDKRQRIKDRDIGRRIKKGEEY